MTNCQVGGVQYGIPAYWLEPVLREATIRQDLLDANNLEMPTSFEELTEAYQVVMDNWTGDGTPYFCRMANDDKRAYFFAPSDPNFVLYEDVVYVNQDVYKRQGHQGVLVFSGLFKEPHPGARPLVPLLHAAVDIVLALPGAGDGAVVHGLSLIHI